MNRIIGLSLSLTICTAALALLQPHTASAEGRAPLRITSGDIDVARRALDELVVQSHGSGQRLVGVPAPAEQARTTLGAPLPVAMIGLDRLRAYQPGAPFDGLVDHLDVALYTVQVDQDARAELEVARVNGAWQAVRVGAPAHAREVVRLSKLSGKASYLVRVPALGVEFLAYGSGDALRLVLVHAVPDVELQAGRPLAAPEVARVLAARARAYNDQLLPKPRP